MTAPKPRTFDTNHTSKLSTWYARNSPTRSPTAHPPMDMPCFCARFLKKPKDDSLSLAAAILAELIGISQHVFRVDRRERPSAHVPERCFLAMVGPARRAVPEEGADQVTAAQLQCSWLARRREPAHPTHPTRAAAQWGGSQDDMRGRLERRGAAHARTVKYRNIVASQNRGSAAPKRMISCKQRRDERSTSERARPAERRKHPRTHGQREKAAALDASRSVAMAARIDFAMVKMTHEQEAEDGECAGTGRGVRGGCHEGQGGLRCDMVPMHGGQSTARRVAVPAVEQAALRDCLDKITIARIVREKAAFCGQPP